MPNMIDYKFGDIILVPFPFTDQSTIKKRPAVVISSALYHESRPDLILMAITSQIRATSFAEMLVQDWQISGLIKPSAIKPIMTTIEKKLILKILGQLQAKDQQNLRQKLEMILG